MQTIYVQFSDSTETSICSYFSNPQDPDVYHNQGEVDLSDPRYKEFYASLPEFVQRDLPTPVDD
ncbi:hypothetical protein BTHA_2670 [Burkholderia thailandensis MSMB59]|nr:hypothetical protein BTHA_2670 [Burkholderia thailandensis MSMB59]